MLSIQSLKYNYTKQFSIVYPEFALLPNEILLLKGPSGCGKSTLMYLIAGLLPIQSGTITLFDEPFDKISSKQFEEIRSEKLGLVFQRNHFLPALSVWENVSINPKSKPDYIHYLAEFLRIDHLLQNKIIELSQGELQRAALVRALAFNPKLVLADEPTSNLDADTCTLIMELFRELRRKKELTLLLITHDERLKDLTDYEINLRQPNR